MEISGCPPDESMFAKKKQFKTKFDKTKIKCFNCGKMGHMQKECRQKKKPYAERSDAHVAFQARMESPMKDKDMWVVDSGASNHMCNNKDLFEDLRTTKTDKYVSVAKAGNKIKSDCSWHCASPDQREQPSNPSQVTRHSTRRRSIQKSIFSLSNYKEWDEGGNG